MKRWYLERVDAKQVAFIVGMSVAMISFFATALALINPNFPTITKYLEVLYGGLGYSISPLGILLGTAYSFVDAFLFVWLIAWVYNKILGKSN